MVTRDLPQPLVITGNPFAFYNAGFSPASCTAQVAAGALSRIAAAAYCRFTRKNCFSPVPAGAVSVVLLP